MDELERLVENMLNAPIGCEFMLSVEASGLAPGAVATPRYSMWLAAMSADLLTRWSGDHDVMVARALEHGERLEPLTRSLLAHPATSWWFDPPDLDHQVWIAHEGRLPNTPQWQRPASPPGMWERYAQKPASPQCTSTLDGNHASLLVAYDGAVDDYIRSFPLHCWELAMPGDVRVFEINGPGDWHELCVRYPVWGQEGGRDQDWLVPDWGAVSEDWDGVHLSIGGLLTAEQVRYESREGWSMLDFWHAEQTFWLRSLDTVSRRLPDFDHTAFGDDVVLADPVPGHLRGVPLTEVEDPGEIEELLRRSQERFGA